MAEEKMKKFSKNARVGLSVLIIAFIAILSIGVTFAVLPRFAEVDTSKAPTVVAIMPKSDNNEISVDADIKNVFVRVKYSDGSVKDVALSELTASGLDTSKPGLLENVELVYGGFKQYVKFNVVPTKLTVRYTTPSGGGRIEGLKVQEIDAGKDASTVRAVPDEGFIFVQWSDGNPNPTRTDTAIKASTDYIATFARRESTVVFQYPDGTLSRERKVEYGKSAANYAPRLEENQMKLYGYKFSHWDKDITRVTEDMTFIPVYEKHAANIHLSITSRDGEAFAMVEQPENFYSKAVPFFQKEEIATLRLKANGGRMFTGWSIRDYLGNWHELPVDTSDESKRIEVAAGGQGFIDFYSPIGITADEFQLTFTPSIGADDIYIRANLIYEQANLSFYSFGEPVVRDNKNLNVSLNNKLSSVIGVIQRERLGDKFVYEDNVLATKGYVFKGWEYTHEGVSHVITQENYAYIQFDQDTRLNAIWEVGTYDVVFQKGLNEDLDFMDINKGYVAEQEARVLRVKYQDNLKNVKNNGVFPNPAVRENYTFVGWFTNKPGGIVSVTLNTILDEEGLVVYPVFEVNKINLNVSTTGSGKAHMNLQDAHGDWYLGPEILSTVLCDVVSQHTVSLVADEGYYISSLKVNGVDVVVAPGATTYDLVFSNPTENKNVAVVYTMFNSAINLINGDNVVSGTVEYLNDIDYGEGGYEVGESIVITASTAMIPVQRNSTKILAISAPLNYSIFNILINGEAAPNLTENARTFKLELEIGATDISVEIIYERAQHLVQIITPLSGMTNGVAAIYEGIANKGLSARFNKGVEDTYIDVKANTGYYIKSVRINGYILNPYASHDVLTNKYLGNAIKVNYVDADISLADPRVTDIRYRVRSLNEDLSIDVEFAKMYYKIFSSHIGQGEVSHPMQVDYGKKVYINGLTTDNYYVYKLLVNSMSLIPSTSDSSYTYTIDSIKQDYDVVFEFAPRTYGVTFAPNDSLSVSHKDVTYNLDSGRTFDKIQRGTNLTFILRADTNYEIEIIRYRKRGEATWTSLPIPYNTSEYEIKIDDISSSYEYIFYGEGEDPDSTVDGIVKKTANYTIKAVTGETNAPSVVIDGGNIIFTSYEFSALGTVSYGNALILSVEPGSGYKVAGLAVQDGLPEDLSFVRVINSTNGANEYQYYVHGEDEPEGLSYTIIKDSDVGYSLQINNIASDLEIILAFEKLSLGDTSPYKITYRDTYLDGGTTKGTVAAYTTDEEPQAILSGGTVDSGAVNYIITPAENYAVKAVIVNGLIIASYTYDEADAGLAREIVYTTAKDQNVEVIFVKQKSQITFVEDEGGSKGLISSNVEFYGEDDTLFVKATPSVGYEISRITVTQFIENGESYFINADTIANNTGYKNTGIFEFQIGSGVYASDGDYLKYNLLVEAEYTPKKYVLNITSTGQGQGEIQLFKGLDLVAYGLGTVTNYDEIYDLRLDPDDESLIKVIIINGFEYDSETVLQNGKYSFKVSGNIDIEVKFERKEYRLRLHASVDGSVTAQINRGGNLSPFLPLDQVILYSTDFIMIDAKSNYGYNVKALKINGVQQWQNTHPTLLYTHYKSQNIAVLDHITGGQTIIDIEIEFVINTYTIKLESINTSPNFSYIDINPSDFGTIAISGRQINPSQIYTGFTHGSNVRVNLRPRIARGYYISKLYIKYADASLGEQDLTHEILNDESDSYLIRNLECNIEYVRVEYTRRIYSVEYTRALYPIADTAKYPFEGSGSEVFAYNPYDRNLTVELPEGMYEYGLSYEIALEPGIGYERTIFEINGIDRQYSVRANTFRAVVIGNVVANSLFEIKTYKVSLDYSIIEDRNEQGELQYDESGNIKYRGEYGEIVVEDAVTGSIIWDISKYHVTSSEMLDISTGSVGIGFDGYPYVIATHNTSLRYKVRPYFEEEGYKITGILKGNSFVSFDNPENEYSFTDNSHQGFILAASFTKSKYAIRTQMATNITNSTISLSETEVYWDGSVTINIIVDKGSYLAKLEYANSATNFDLVTTIYAYGSQLSYQSSVGSYDIHQTDSNGKQNITYTLSGIKTPISFRVEIARNKYDITVEREYNKGYLHNGETYSAGIKIVTNDDSANSMYAPNSMYPSYSYGTSILNSLIPVEGSGTNLAKVQTIDAYGYMGLSDDDSVMIYITAPTGYDISTIQVTMEDFGGIISYVINGADDLSIARYGLYDYRIGIQNATGNINISVTYKIRKYQLKQEPTSHGGYTIYTTSDAIEHHAEFEVEIIADFGYRLESFYINAANRINNLTSSKSASNQYVYSTTVSGIKARMVDAYTSVNDGVNLQNNYEIPLISSFTSLKYNIEIYVKEGSSAYRLITSPEISMLQVNLSNPQVIYDITYQGYNFHHTLQEGTEVKAINFYNQNRNNPGAESIGNYYRLRRNVPAEALTIDSFTSINPSFGTLKIVGDELLKILDFHDSERNKIFLYYDVAIKNFEIKTYFRYIASSGSDAFGYTSSGSDVTSIPNASVVINSTDNKQVSPITGEGSGSIHDYGTSISYIASIPDINVRKVQFVGFQEEIDGVWQYIPRSSGMISGTGNNQTLTISVKANRNIRAVFYQVFVVNVVIMPKYQTTGVPSESNFTRYETSLKAYVRYDKTEAENRTLPYVENPTSSSNDYLEEELKPINTEAYKVNYEFLVKSGSLLRMSSTASLAIEYYISKPGGPNVAYSEVKADEFKFASTGYTVNKNLIVNAITNKAGYALITRQTLGAEANAGANIQYKIDSGSALNLTSSYVKVDNNRTLEIIITVNPNYRFDLLAYKSTTSSSDGRLIFGEPISMKSGDDEGRTTVRYEDSNGETLQVPENVAEKQRVKKIIIRTTNFAIQKSMTFKFVKQIRVYKHALLLRNGINEPSAVEDGTVKEIDGQVNRIVAGEFTSVASQYFDYNQELSYQLEESYQTTVSDYYKRPVQFVGFSINGVNFERDLGSEYPNPADVTTIVLNDLDTTLENGVRFVYETDHYDANLKTYVVRVVARFVPLLNVLIENDYESSPGEYVDTGSIAVGGIRYSENSMSLSENIDIVNSQYVDPNTSEIVYTNRLLKVPVKVNSSLNSSENGYDIWKNNVINLNWLSENDRRSIAFVQWEYFAYSPNSVEQGEWIPIPYTQEIGGRIATSKDTNYSFPLSALLPQYTSGASHYRTYYYYTKSDGEVQTPDGFSGGSFADFMGMDHIATYDANGMIIPGQYLASMPVLRIRPKYERRVYLDIASYLSSEVEGQYDIVNPSSFGNLVNPSIGDTGLVSQSLPLNTVVILKPNTIEDKFIFEGWYYRPRKVSPHGELVLFDNEITSVPIYGTEETKDITYKYIATVADRDAAIASGLLPQSASFVDFNIFYKNTLVLKLDWPEGDYLIGTKYKSLYEINITVKNESGSSNYILNKSRLEVDYYGMSSPTAENKWALGNLVDSGANPADNIDGRVDEYSITLKVPAGKLALFKLNTQYNGEGAGRWNDYVFNPHYDEYTGIYVYANGDLSTNVWYSGVSSDYSFSENHISPNTANARNVGAIKSANFAILGNADKIVEIRMKSYGCLNIHNVFEGAAIRLPDVLAQELSIPNGLVEDNGPLDEDDTVGVIKLIDIPIKPEFNIDGQTRTDYGIKISEFLTGQKVLASENYQHDVTLDANDPTLRKEQHVVIFGTKAVNTWNKDLGESGGLESVTFGKNLEKPFESGKGSQELPFIIKSAYQFKQIESLYIGNEDTLHYGSGGRFHFELGADINLSDLENPVSEPLCASGILGFNGVLDGKNYTLYGLSLDRNDSAGLFKILTDGAEIKNVKIAADMIASYMGFAGFFAPLAESQSMGIVVENISVSSDVSHELGTYVGNFVGSLIGKVTTSTHAMASFTLKNITLNGAQVNSNFVVPSNEAADYETALFGSTSPVTLRGYNARGAAGGVIGFASGRIIVENITLDDMSVRSLNGKFAGGFIGIADTASSIVSNYTNVKVIDPNIEVGENFAGGIFGVLGSYQNLLSSTVEITQNTPHVTGAIAYFAEAPDDASYKATGIGGAVGLNKGLISNFHYLGSGIYTLTSGIVGGIAGINEHMISATEENYNLIEGSAVKLRSDLSTQMDGGVRKGGGIFGGVTGWNMRNGNVIDITIAGNEYNGYSNYGTRFGQNSAFYEVAYNSAYTSQTQNYAIHKDLQTRVPNAETTTAFISGMVGYNSAVNQGQVINLTFATKLVVYRENDASTIAKTFVNAISNFKAAVSSSAANAKVEYMKLTISDNTSPISHDGTPVALTRVRSIDDIGRLNPASNVVYIRYLTLGSYYIKGLGHILQKDRKYSRDYSFSEITLITPTSTTTDIVCNQVINPENHDDYTIMYNGVNLAEGKIEEAGGTATLWNAYNYIGHIRQPKVYRSTS